MAKLPSRFNSDEHEDMADYSAMPAGNYRLKIKSSDRVENKRKTGFYYKFVFQVTEGKFSKRLLFANLNLEHINPDTVEMAEKELAAICKACGMGSIADTDELHGSELMGKVTVKPASAQYAESNEIKKYSRIDGLAVPAKPQSKKAMEKVKPKTGKKKVSFD